MQAFRIDITTFDAQGNQLDYIEIQEVSNEFVIVGMNFKEQNLIDAGVADINEVAYFKVAMLNGEEIFFRYVDDCNATKYQVNWLNKYFPSGLYDMLFTPISCPSNVLIHLPLPTSHIFTVLSLLPLTIYFPSGL